MSTAAKALTRNVRISPRKARLAADLIRGKRVIEAIEQLSFSQVRGARLILKTLKSAIANAENGKGLDKKTLRVSKMLVNEGPTLKRAKSKNKGGRVPILKRTSHFHIELEELSN